MGRKRNRFKAKAKASSESMKATPVDNGPTMFSFGDPEPVLNGNLGDYLGTFLQPGGDYYVPPVSQTGLINLLGANAHHGTIPYFKRNQLRKWFKPGGGVRTECLAKAGFDNEVLGHCYFKKKYNAFGHLLRLEHLPGVNMRRMKESDRFCMLQPNGADPVVYEPGEVVQLKEYDPAQQIYGRPQYLGGVQSVLLNEDSTLFRRRYYNNGAHMGYIFYTADAHLSPEDEAAIKEQIKSSKGVGNFRSMFLNIPNGKEKSVQIIPVGDIATKDEFERIKNLTRNDILSMWRIQPALAGVMPENSGGFGDIEKITRVYFENEVVPMQDVFLQLNEWLPRNKRIEFTKPEFALNG
ncbi:phage portal protein [Microbulbifer sp. VAAF005]|uniref:phage portal protein n=1 Tax=Microbulbifer sp. VAAF005 TaxID=3034230 RepID=UPI0024AE521B|nr:phage portal protein [Microbulbifer sp. VAAF005]WHI45024.1 phage portal protein [Microbulbifer sp. VAAF005]